MISTLHSTASEAKKSMKKKLKWDGHTYAVEERRACQRRMLDAPVPGKTRRGRQKTRGKDSCKRDMESVGLNVKDI